MRKLIFLVALLLGGLPGPAVSQSVYPSKPVRMIVLSAPNEAIDILARTLGSVFTQRSGQPLTIMNRPGASGVEFARNAPADGYTILISSDNVPALPTGFSPVVLLARGAGNSQVFGMYLPAGAAKDVVDRLNAIVNAILKMPDIVQKVAKQGLQLGGGTPGDLARVALVKGTEPKKGEIAALPTRGVLTFGGGARYEGDVVQGKAQGKGVLTFPSGARYEGEFVGNKYQGKGIYTSPSGQRYEGDHVAGARQGKGVLTWPSGQRYEGDFMNGKYSGYGVMTLSDGTRYAGNWLNGERTGQTQQTSQAVHAESRIVDASVASSVGGVRKQVWPPAGTPTIKKGRHDRTWWYNAKVLDGMPGLTGYSYVNELSYSDGWKGLQWVLGDKVILVMPSAETVRQLAVDCGLINVKWVQMKPKRVGEFSAWNEPFAQLAVLGEGNCVNGKPDGDVVLYGPDGLTQLTATYRNGQAIGRMVFRQIQLSPNYVVSSDFAKHVEKFILATGTAATVMRDGVAWLEFGKVESYAEISGAIVSVFAGGKTDHFLPTGSGQCSQQLTYFEMDNPNQWKTRYLQDPAPCHYSKALIRENGWISTNRDDAKYVAYLAAFTAEEKWSQEIGQPDK